MLSALALIMIPLAIFLGSIALFFLFVVLTSYFNILSQFRGWTNRKNVHLSQEGKQAEEQLLNLGFHYEGIAKYGMIAAKNTNYCIFYTDPNKIVLVIIVQINTWSLSEYSIGFWTWFPDNSLIEMQYPNDRRFCLSSCN
jgi:hypothetical protein